MSELQRAVAFVFKRKGQKRLPSSEFKHVVSLDLRWFAPADTKRFYQAAVQRGFLREEGEHVLITFDPATVTVPIQLKPHLDVIDEEGPVFTPPPPPPPPAEQEATRSLVTDIARALELDREALEAAARQETERSAGLLAHDVALLVAARRRGLDVRAYAAQLGSP